jgi:hypothetical protein
MADIVIINPRFDISFWGWSIASACSGSGRTSQSLVLRYLPRSSLTITT